MPNKWASLIQAPLLQQLRRDGQERHEGFPELARRLRSCFHVQEIRAQARTNDSARFRACEGWSVRCEYEYLNETSTKVCKVIAFTAPLPVPSSVCSRQLRSGSAKSLSSRRQAHNGLM